MNKERSPTPPAAVPSRSRSGGRLVAFLAVAGILAGVWWLSARRAAPFAIARTPDQNVLLITIDTLRADALGSYGGVASTPALDRLAAAGIRFTFAHAHAPLTLVSHASMLSGLYPFQHGIRDNSGFRFPQSIPTAADAIEGRRFRHGRIRRRLSPALPVRPERRVRPLRRELPRDDAAERFRDF